MRVLGWLLNNLLEITVGILGTMKHVKYKINIYEEEELGIPEARLFRIYFFIYSLSSPTPNFKSGEESGIDEFISRLF